MWKESHSPAPGCIEGPGAFCRNWPCNLGQSLMPRPHPAQSWDVLHPQAPPVLPVTCYYPAAPSPEAAAFQQQVTSALSKGNSRGLLPTVATFHCTRDCFALGVNASVVLLRYTQLSPFAPEVTASQGWLK